MNSFTHYLSLLSYYYSRAKEIEQVETIRSQMSNIRPNSSADKVSDPCFKEQESTLPLNLLRLRLPKLTVCICVPGEERKI